MGSIALEGGGMKRQVFVPVDEAAQALPASFQRLIRLDHHGAATKTVIRLVACESFMAGVINEYQQAPVSCDQVGHTSIEPVHRSTYVNCQRSKACSASASSAPSSALGNLFDVMVETPQIAELIVGGFLVKSRVYAPIDPDLKGVKVQQGDYVISQLAGRMNTAGLVGDLVEHWHKHGEQRRTIAFAVDVAHSVAIRNQFLGAGVPAEHLDGETPIPEREAILARLASGETKVVSNCMVLTEGWDCPPVGCCILARPTKQMGLFRQMVGRVLRPADGKADAVILDH